MGVSGAGNAGMNDVSDIHGQNMNDQTDTPSIKNARILIVDDEPRLLKSLCDLLTEQHFAPEQALGGRDACNRLRAEPFDLVLLDLRMPEVDGHDVMAFLEQHRIDVPVIVISGEASFTSVSRALRRGAQDYLRKPYDPDELLTTVNNVLQKRALEEAHEAVQAQLQRSEELHRYIVNTSPDIVFMLDNEGRLCFVNDKIESLLGYAPSELVGRHFRHLIDEQDIRRGLQALEDPDISADNPRTFELRLKTRGSRKPNRHFEITAFPIGDNPVNMLPSDGVAGNTRDATIYGSARDVTDRKEAEAFINFQAYHDLLTRLPNRALFQDRLMLAMTQAERKDQKLAVMFLDLDRFKVINDSLGHGMGDRLLQSVTQRLGGCLRGGDTLSRFGGDEFTLLLPDIESREDARRIARKLIDALKAPFQLGEHEVFVGVSIGIALFPESGNSIDELIQAADIAMYHVKASGKDGYRFFSDTMSVDSAHRLSLERDLRQALVRDELRVHFQPQVSGSSGDIVGVEALVRWQHPERGLLYPRDFLPLAEETRLIADLSEKVVELACRHVGRWIREGRDDLRLAVNLSPIQVDHPRFVDNLMECLTETGFPPENLEIEITENVIMTDLEQISRKLRKLAGHGVRIAIDDFGTGYSSLNYLHRLPIHTLKVDQSFVHGIRRGEEGACIVNAIVAMAHGLELDIVAEGVETDLQLAYLRNLGCQQIQGFYYGAATPAAEIERRLFGRRPVPTAI
ncbi:PAS domain S-box-containing protein/diguanylate cyclase (GGDEF)-like protein [Tamilnaduibacter salinus]|uniref:cyclic-guanylate-specific phosphodiesterase n=2 Tax=Tamilnaduibacter salinus TaxID=1484056 RepID=A0A2U1D0T9_9GAMM|nr:PAS domain S-box-containing protein/diguanylate cyclase (GGDEF)-like protein [Tamilnaduibacter salinus]